MYHVDLKGQMSFEKLNLREERIDLLDNPLLGPLLRRKEQLIKSEVMTKRANQLSVYYLNLHKRYDLDVIGFPHADVELPAIQTHWAHGLGARRILPLHDLHRNRRHLSQRTVLVAPRVFLQLGTADGGTELQQSGQGSSSAQYFELPGLCVIQFRNLSASDVQLHVHVFVLFPQYFADLLLVERLTCKVKLQLVLGASHPKNLEAVDLGDKAWGCGGHLFVVALKS